MKRKLRADRSGAVLICVLACLVIVTGLVLTIMQQSLQSRRETKYRLQVRQTELLLDAGLLRAAKRIRKSRDYTGETWLPTEHLPLDAVDRLEHATVKIDIREATNPDQRTIRVTASMGGVAGDMVVASRTVQSHEFTISLFQSEPTNAESDDE